MWLNVSCNKICWNIYLFIHIKLTTYTPFTIIQQTMLDYLNEMMMYIFTFTEIKHTNQDCQRLC